MRIQSQHNFSPPYLQSLEKSQWLTHPPPFLFGWHTFAVMEFLMGKFFTHNQTANWTQFLNSHTSFFHMIFI